MNRQSLAPIRNRSLRPALLAALFLWIALAGLRPSPALAACGSPTVVTTEAQLEDAINDFNGQAGPCAYEIEFGNDITLTDHLSDLDNGNAGVTLLIAGAGFTLDGDGFDTFNINNVSAATIDDITIIHSLNDGIGVYGTNMRVSRAAMMNNESDAMEISGGSLVVVDSTFAFNFDDGLDAYDETTTIDIINTTIAGNGDTALYIYGSDAVLTHVTVAGNSSGLYVDNSTVTIDNSILDDNEINCEAFGGTIDINFSLFDSTDDACGAVDGVDGNIVGDDAQLVSLGDYGGPTPTMPPFNLTGGITATSPVVDAGDDALSVDETNSALDYDQRGAGFPRVVNGEADMGAVEGPESLTCPAFPATVVDEDEWRVAVLCYNNITAAGTYTINLGADIELTAAPPAIDNNEAGVSLVVEGGDFALDGQDNEGVRPLTVAADTMVTVNDATITGGNVVGDDSQGGGVYNAGDLTLNHITVTGNRTDGNGGGIYNDDGGTLDFNDGEISENLAAAPDGDGGGINNVGHMTLSRSRVIDNTADGDSLVLGGGILTEAVMTITDSTIAGNTVSAEDEEAIGGGINNQATLVIVNSTISDNEATADFLVRGGGISSETDLEAAYEFGYGAELTLINSTVSGNIATGEDTVYGGGLFIQDYDFDCCFDATIPVTLINTTLSDNTVTATESSEAGGGGAYFLSNEPAENTLAVRIDNSILANSTTDGAAGGDCVLDSVPAFDSNFSLYEDSNAGACGLAPANPDADGNIVGVDPVLGPLADNGGPTQTHLPGALSEALDSGSNPLAVDENGDPLATDQRGYVSRIVNGTVDMGSVEVGAEPPPSDSGDIFLSAKAAGTTGDGLDFGPHDVLRYDGSAWSKFFDGSAAGLMPNGKAVHNVNAVWVPDPGESDVALSFAQNARHVPGITGKVNGMDLVWWDGDAEEFSLWFDGSDVDLTNMTQEKIDALHVLPGDGPCLYYLLISTQGPGRVSNTGEPAIKFSGEDVLGFCATNLGENTAGFWSLLLDGSAEGMPKNSTTSISVSADGETLYLTTGGTFNVDSATGGHSMVYAYDFTAEEFSGPLFVAADEGLPRPVDGLDVVSLPD